MKLLIDMNLSPQWVAYLAGCGFEAVHWSSVGPATEKDAEIMCWAKAHGYIVLTHDLDFGAILAATNAAGPSVVQMRMQDVLPDTAGVILVNTLRVNEPLIEEGALVVIDRFHSRVRILPLRAD